jgi:Fe-S oxidoreductase
MCPSYRATLDEEHSTRGRANALRLAMTGQLGPDGMTSRRVFEVMDLCLSCKSCKSECPSNVDVARLKSEFLQKHHDAHGTSLRERLVAGSATMARMMAGRKAPIVNFLQETWLFRTILQLLAGFDSRRKPPRYATVPLPKWFAARSQPNGRAGEKVVLFDDTYMNYHQTEIGISAVELLESCGYEVILARAGCCQRPRISHGFLRDARAKGEQTLRNLDEYIQQGLKVVVCEPGCCSALTDDLPDLIDDEQLGARIKENVMMIDDFFARQVSQGNLKCEFTSPYEKILIHGHCHQKSLYGTGAMKQLLNRVPGLSVCEVDSGCCGMAGSFGYENEHYELSAQIGEDRLLPAVRRAEKGTVTVACGFSCRHQIADGANVKALHWVETIRGAGVSD